MIQHHANRQHVLGFVERLDAVLVAVLNPKLVELWQILRHGVIERYLAFLDQLRNRHTAETLCLRALHEHIVELDGAFLLHIRIADAARLLHAVVIENTDCTRQLTAVKVRLKCLFGKRCLRIGDFLLAACTHAKHDQQKEKQFLHNIIMC